MLLLESLRIQPLGLATGGVSRVFTGGAKKVVAKQAVTRLGKIKNVITPTVKGAVTEGVGEGIQEASVQAGVESAISGTDFGDEFVDALSSERTLRAATVGGIVGGSLRTARTGIDAVKNKRQSDLQTGLDVVEDAAKGDEASQETKDAITISQEMAKVESPETSNQEVQIANELATPEQLQEIVSENSELSVIPNEDGTSSVIKQQSSNRQGVIEQKRQGDDFVGVPQTDQNALNQEIGQKAGSILDQVNQKSW